MIYGPLLSFSQLLDATAIPHWLLGGEELSAGRFHLPIILEVPSAQEMSHRPEKVVVGWRKVRTVSGMGLEETIVVRICTELNANVNASLRLFRGQFVRNRSAAFLNLTEAVKMIHCGSL